MGNGAACCLLELHVNRQQKQRQLPQQTVALKERCSSEQSTSRCGAGVERGSESRCSRCSLTARGCTAGKPRTWAARSRPRAMQTKWSAASGGQKQLAAEAGRCASPRKPLRSVAGVGSGTVGGGGDRCLCACSRMQGSPEAAMGSPGLHRA